MGKSLRARLKQLCCCFHDDFSDSDSTPPYIRQDSLPQEEIKVDDENTRKTSSMEAVKKTVIKKIEVQISNLTSEIREPKNSEINRLTTDAANKTNLDKVEYETERTIETVKANDHAADTRKKIKCMNTSIERKVDTGYLVNNSLESIIVSAPEDRFADRQPKFPAFKQTVTTHQGKLHDRGIVNTWSRHMSDTGAGHQMYFTNVNLDKINVPYMKTETRRGIVKDGNVKNGDWLKNMCSGKENKSGKADLYFTDLILDTRNVALRPKGAGRERTKHCFTNSGVYKKL